MSEEEKLAEILMQSTSVQSSVLLLKNYAKQFAIQQLEIAAVTPLEYDGDSYSHITELINQLKNE